MAPINNEQFKKVWPRCFVIFIGIVEAIATIFLVLTEIGNVAASFWYTNVFAGGWCGIIMLAHFIALFVTGCSPTPAAALRAVVIDIIALVACATLIVFDAFFIARPSTCILTSSCSTNAVSTTVFSYSFQQNFYTAFTALSAFKSYSQTQTKYFFQTIQLSVGCLCFVLCIVFLVIYYVVRSKAAGTVGPNDGVRSAQPAPYRSYGNSPQQQQQQYQQQQQQQRAYPPQRAGPAPAYQYGRNPNKKY